MGALGAVEVRHEASQLGAGPCARPGMRDQLVAVAETVDQSCLHRLLGEQGPAVDRLPHLAFGQFPPQGDALDNLPGDRRQQRLDLLAMRRGHLGLGQQVHRGLVLLAMIEFGDDPEEVERSLDERRFRVEPGQADIADWLQPDLVERRRQIIGPRSRAKLAKAVGKSYGELALASERRDCVADLLDLGQTELVITEAGEQDLDPRIVGGGFDRIEKVTQCRLAAGNQTQQRVFACAFGQILRQIHGQDDVARERRDRRLQSGDDDQDAGDEQHRE